MTKDNEAVREGLRAEYEQMNSTPFAAMGLTYRQAGEHADYRAVGKPEAPAADEAHGEQREERGNADFPAGDGYSSSEE
ncbi:hypothetical protein [Gorillibacterium sp. sgz500922]|uniref:hypothetical protein n=1 Tax=Gorillibacterium sp. sgz500922 TaxID=3446694 RepID=UPI003F67F296